MSTDAKPICVIGNLTLNNTFTGFRLDDGRFWAAMRPITAWAFAGRVSTPALSAAVATTIRFDGEGDRVLS